MAKRGEMSQQFAGDKNKIKSTGKKGGSNENEKVSKDKGKRNQQSGRGGKSGVGIKAQASKTTLVREAKEKAGPVKLTRE